MTQTVILNKFIALATHEYEIYNRILENEKRTDLQQKLKNEYEQLIKTLKSGHCFGFTVIDGVMDLLGKLLWWRSLLQKIATWNEDIKLLSEPIILPDAKPIQPNDKNKESDFIKNQNTLKELMKRALHYVGFSQCCLKDPFIPKTMHQGSFMHPMGFLSAKNPIEISSFLEYTDDNNIFTIKNYIKIAGNFTEEQMLKIFSDKDTLKDNLVILHGRRHAIRFKDGTPHCMIYNSNYDHHDVETMQMEGTTEECVTEIIDTLGTAICVEVASTDPSKKLSIPVYEEIKKTDFLSLLRGDGIFEMANYTPNVLWEHLNEAKKNADLRDNTIDICKNAFTNILDQSTKLRFLMRSGKIFSLLLELGKASIHYAEMHANIVKAVNIKNKKGNNAFNTLIKRHPQYIMSFCDFLMREKKDILTLIYIFTTSNNENKTPWTILGEKAPAKKKELFNYTMKKIINMDYDFYAAIPSAETLSFSDLFLKALMLKLNGQKVNYALQAVLSETPEIFSGIVTFALAKSTNVFTEIISIFDAADNGSTMWQKLALHPAEKSIILTLMTKHINGVSDESSLKAYRRDCSINSFCKYRTRTTYNPRPITTLNSEILKIIDAELASREPENQLTGKRFFETAFS